MAAQLSTKRHSISKCHTEFVNKFYQPANYSENKRIILIEMFSLCRLCAEYKEATELTTQLFELEFKLVLCCGWNASENESEMPSKACDLCVEQLEKSWCFAENVKAAEHKLTKLVSELNQIDQSELMTFDEMTLTTPSTVKQEPEICSVQVKGFEYSIDAFDGPSTFADESLHSNESTLEEETTKKIADKTKTFSEPFLAALTDEDRLTDGTISVNGVDKLTKSFPDMATISWTNCVYKCEKCDRTFDGPHNFFAHNRSIHIDEVQSMEFGCFYCNSRHRREYTLSRHMALEHFQHLKFR